MPRAAPPERIVDRRRIRQVLQRLHHARATLAAHPREVPVAASTLILGFSGDGILLDGLFPAPAQRAVQPGSMLLISARLDGVGIQGQLQVSAVEASADGDLIHARVPDMLLWSQRRSAYRVPAIGLPPCTLVYGGDRMRARLVDLSVLGLGATVASEQAFKPGTESVWEVPLPEGLLIAGVRICSAVPERGLTRLGGEYVDLNPTQRGAVQRAVTALQREVLRAQRSR